MLRALSLCTCCRQYPGTATGCPASLDHPSHISLPRYGCQVGPCIVLFEDCSAFTRVTACTLALSPYFVTLFTRRLQPFRCLHSCSGYFRLERLPGGTYTHRKAPPLHGARQEESFENVFLSNPSYISYCEISCVIIDVFDTDLVLGCRHIVHSNRGLSLKVCAFKDFRQRFSIG